ncbi:MAG: hypothetical protein JEY91_16290, partial [Spirochaetaceae bacterium]|nr:hypothetical protein [Spirochaetaceae bacterium]
MKTKNNSWFTIKKSLIMLVLVIVSGFVITTSISLISLKQIRNINSIISQASRTSFLFTKMKSNAYALLIENWSLEISLEELEKTYGETSAALTLFIKSSSTNDLLVNLENESQSLQKLSTLWEQIQV